MVRLPKSFEILLVYEVLKYEIWHSQQKLCEIFQGASFPVKPQNHLIGGKAGKVMIFSLLDTVCFLFGTIIYTSTLCSEL